MTIRSSVVVLAAAGIAIVAVAAVSPTVRNDMRTTVADAAVVVAAVAKPAPSAMPWMPPIPAATPAVRPPLPGLDDLRGAIDPGVTGSFGPNAGFSLAFDRTPYGDVGIGTGAFRPSMPPGSASKRR